jgi:hypothetical protein
VFGSYLDDYPPDVEDLVIDMAIAGAMRREISVSNQRLSLERIRRCMGDEPFMDEYPLFPLSDGFPVLTPPVLAATDRYTHDFWEYGPAYSPLKGRHPSVTGDPIDYLITFQTLSRLAWIRPDVHPTEIRLDDNLINTYLGFLRAFVTKSRSDYPIFFFDTYWQPTLHKRFKAAKGANKDSQEYQSLVRLLNSLPFWPKFYTKGATILIPCNPGLTHWTLAIFRFVSNESEQDTFEYTYWDSLASPTTTAHGEEEIKTVIAWLKALRPTTQMIFKRKSMADSSHNDATNYIQPNGYDCGVYLLYKARAEALRACRMALSIAVPKSKNQHEYMRRLLAWEFLDPVNIPFVNHT